MKKESENMKALTEAVEKNQSGICLTCMSSREKLWSRTWKPLSPLYPFTYLWEISSPWICLCMATQVERGENLSYHSLSCAEGLLWKYTCFAVNIALSQMVVLCFLLVKKLFFRAHFKIETSSTVTVHTLIALYTTDDALVACDASLHEYRIFFSFP